MTLKILGLCFLFLAGMAASAAIFAIANPESGIGGVLYSTPPIWWFLGAPASGALAAILLREASRKEI